MVGLSVALTVGLASIVSLAIFYATWRPYHTQYARMLTNHQRCEETSGVSTMEIKTDQLVFALLILCSSLAASTYAQQPVISLYPVSYTHLTLPTIYSV